MKVAVVAHPPVFGGRVKRIVDDEARRIEGVRDVFEIPLAKGTGVAVVADKFWPAKQARNLLKIEWDVTGVEAADSSELWTRYKQLGQHARQRCRQQAAMQKRSTRSLRRNRIVAEYEFPYLAHSPMEPLNTTVRFDGDRAEVWAGSQFQTVDQMAVAEVLGLKPEQVTFHTEMAGGGFGRRAVTDSHVQREAARDRETSARHSSQTRLDARRRRAGWLLSSDALSSRRSRCWSGWIPGRVAARDRGPVVTGGHSFRSLRWSRTAWTKRRPKALLTRTTTFRIFTSRFIIRR